MLELRKLRKVCPQHIDIRNELKKAVKDLY